MTKRKRECEEGTALLLAMLVLVFGAVVVASALAYASSSLRGSSTSYKPERTKLYDANSALQTAIQYVKNNPVLGRAPVDGVETCPTTVVSYQGSSGPATVNVCPQNSSFVPRGQAKAVLLTLAPSGGPSGLTKSGGSAGSLLLNGDVWVNSDITNLGTGGIQINGGRLFVRGACPGTITVAPPGTKNCALGAGPTPGISQDPNFSPAITTLPVAGTARTCDSTHHVLTLNPGTYDQTLLNSLTATCPSLQGIVFGAGATDNPADSTYYFHDVQLPNGRVVGGTATTSWLNNPNDTGLITSSFGTRCDQTQRGVQFVLGTNATMNEGPGDEFDVCGFDSAQRGGQDNPRIVLYGIKPAQSGVATMNATSAGSGAFFTFGPGWPGDGSIATATIPRRTTATQVETTFTTADVIPPGSTINSVTLQVPHDEGGTNSVRPTVSWSGGGCTAGGPNTLNHHPTAATDIATISGCTAAPTSSFTVTYSLGAPNNADIPAELGDMHLVVNWTAPQPIAGTGQVCASSGCAVVQTHGNGGEVHLVGSIYMPSGSVDLQDTNVSVETVTDSAVVYTITLSASSSIGTIPSIGNGGGVFTDGDVVYDVVVGSNNWVSSRVAYTNGGAGPTRIRTWVDRR